MKRTWVYIILLAAFVGVFLLLRNPDSDIDSTGTTEETEGTAVVVPTVQYLFPGEEGVVTTILLESREGKLLSLERQGSAWVSTKPFFAETVPGSVEEAASQLNAIPIQKSLDLASSDVGLDSPAYTITVGFTSGNFIIVQVGDETPTGDGYYIRKDDGPVLVVSTYDLAPVLQMLSLPPLVDTPTPTPAPPTTTPTTTPTLEPAATGTPPTATKAP